MKTIFDLLMDFEEFYIKDDPRTSILRSSHQKIIYSYAREKTTITLEEFKFMYAEPIAVLRCFMQLKFLGFLKSEDNITFQFIPYEKPFDDDKREK